MKLGDGLFLRSCEEISKLYPNIEFETMIVDNTTMQLVSKPQQFDVMVMLIVKKSGDNYSLSADFLANSSHIMAGISPL